MKKIWNQLAALALVVCLIIPGEIIKADTMVSGDILLEEQFQKLGETSNFENSLKEKPIYDYSKTDGFSKLSEDNTDANGAYLIDFNAPESGSITTEKEQRWFGVIANKRMRISTILVTPKDAAVDMDLYFYVLNEETYTLELQMYSEQNPGENELVDMIVDPGIYYICVNGYKGTGNFAIEAYSSYQYLDKEINDTLSTATKVPEVFNVTDAISTPLDMDCYQFEVPGSGRNMTFTLTQFKGADYRMYVSDPVNGLKNIVNGEVCSFNPGVNYIIIISGDGSYSDERTYSLSSTSSPKGEAILSYGNYTLRQSGNSYYINDKIIDFNYLYEYHVDAGGGDYLDAVMKLTPSASTNIITKPADARYGTMFIEYETSFPNLSRGIALYIPVTGVDYFYNRVGSGLLGPSAYEKMSDIRADVIIDVDTGKVIDLYSPNWYYTSSSSHHTHIIKTVLARVY